MNTEPGTRKVRGKHGAKLLDLFIHYDNLMDRD